MSPRKDKHNRILLLSVYIVYIDNYNIIAVLLLIFVILHFGDISIRLPTRDFSLACVFRCTYIFPYCIYTLNTLYYVREFVHSVWLKFLISIWEISPTTSTTHPFYSDAFVGMLSLCTLIITAASYIMGGCFVTTIVDFPFALADNFMRFFYDYYRYI